MGLPAEKFVRRSGLEERGRLGVDDPGSLLAGPPSAEATSLCQSLGSAQRTFPIAETLPGPHTAACSCFIRAGVI